MGGQNLCEVAVWCSVEALAFCRWAGLPTALNQLILSVIFKSFIEKYSSVIGFEGLNILL